MEPHNWFSPLPGSPPDQAAKYQGPWLQTQLILAGSLGISSFLLFAFLRPRYTLLYAPRTKLQGFSPSQAHQAHSAWSWIVPTLRTSERVVLQIVGLDAAVLLSFFKMCFWFFTLCTVAAVAVLIPFNVSVHGSVDSEPDDTPDNSTTPDYSTSTTALIFQALKAHAEQPSGNSTTPPTLVELLTDPTTSLSLHLLFTNVFAFLALYTLYRAFNHFLISRQLFSLELVHSVSSRTVLVSALPPYLRGERALADYFERLGWGVESVSCVREIGRLSELLNKRTRALLELENAWVEFVGNPSNVDSNLFHQSSAPSPSGSPRPSDGPASERLPLLEIPGRRRPQIRVGGNMWAFWRRKVDKIVYFEEEFSKWDQRVREVRREGRFEASGAAFVTMESMADAQTAAQVIHSAKPDECLTTQAPEPRDVVWPNVGKSERNRWIRDLVIMGFMATLLLFWLVPVSALATLLSYDELSRLFPSLTKVLDKSPPLRAFVQNSLPSMALIGFNALLPSALEVLCYAQGLQARSWIEHSLLKKYFLFLLISVVFVWNITTTYWALFRDLADSPLKIPEKLAQSLSAGPAKHFFLSYVILQGCGIMPFQLLNIGTIISLGLKRLIWTTTPRDFAELNAPPMLNYGTVYPQALLVFVITLIYSVVSPLILPFGAIYFGMGYLVYKYKLLFVFYKPYESRGQAWSTAFSRMVLGIVLFEVFMTGLFLLKKAYIIASCMTPVIIFTIYWSWRMYQRFEPLATYVSLSLIAEVQKGESAERVLRVGYDALEGEVTRSQANLNRRRYANNQDDLYLAPADDRTDYSQPPMGGYYAGVLNTGKRRYAHPALAGSLPTPWLPLKKGESLLAQAAASPAAVTNGGNKTRPRQLSVVLSLGRKAVKKFRPKARDSPAEETDQPPAQEPLNGAGERLGSLLDGMRVDVDDAERNPWRDSYQSTAPGVAVRRQEEERARRLRKKLSFDPATGVIMLPHSEDEDSDNGSDDDQDDDDDSPPPRGLAPPASGMVRSETTPLLSTAAGSSSSSSAGYRPYFPHKRSRTASSPAAPPTLDLKAKGKGAPDKPPK